MENRVLKYFLVVAREENITRASEILHISQPALSRQLMQLEDELGAQLFTRGKRNITLTDEGRFLRRRAQEIIELTEKTERDFRDGIDSVSGTVSIGMPESAVSGWLADIIKDFSLVYPNVRFDLHSNNADYIKEQIEKGLLDLGILIEPFDISKYDSLKLPVKDTWGVLVPSKCPLAQKEFVTPQDLKDRKIFVSRRPLAVLTEWLGECYNEKNLHITYNLVYNVAILVERGMGAALTIDGAVSLYHNPNIIFRPLSPELIFSSVLVYKKYQTVSPSVLKFIDFVKEKLRVEE